MFLLRKSRISWNVTVCYFTCQKPEDLFSVISKAEAKNEAETKLQNFEVNNESVPCPEASTLHTINPYVKRLVRIFLQIKENVKEKLTSVRIRNSVYQYETRHYVKTIHKRAINFKHDALGLREFLTSDHQTGQLRMLDGVGLDRNNQGLLGSPKDSLCAQLLQ